jgi:uncharacterized membrane protein
MAVLAAFAAICLSAAGWSHPPAEHEPPAAQQAEADMPPHEAHAATHVESEPASGQMGETAHAHDGEAPRHEEAHDHSAAPSPAPTGHAHWGEHGASTPFERAMSRLGVFHSVAVHFPIALILAAALAQALLLAGRFPAGADTVRFLVWTGAVSGVIAALLGWAHSGPMASGEAGVMLAHRVIGTGLLIGLAGLAVVGEWARKSKSGAPAVLFSVVLFGLAGTLMLNGFLGGALAHGGLRHLFGG